MFIQGRIQDGARCISEQKQKNPDLRTKKHTDGDFFYFSVLH